MKNTKTRPYTPAGLIAMTSGVTIWGMGVVLIKLTVSPFLVVSVYRHAFAVPILIVAWLFASDRRLPWRVAGVGGVLFAVHQIAHFSSLRYSTAAVVTILFSLQPILVGAFGGRFTGETANRSFFLWSGVAIGGCAVLILASTGQPEATGLGTLLATLNLIAWSAYYLATKRARAEVSTISWLLVITIVSGAIITAIALITGQPFFEADSREWMYLVLIGLGPATLGHLFVTWAQPRIHVAASSTLNLLVPIVASIGAAIFLDESFGAIHALGALIALGGAFVAMRQLPPPVTEEASERFGEVAT